MYFFRIFLGIREKYFTLVRTVHTCVVFHAVTTTCRQIEHIEINYDAHTNVVRPCVVCQYDSFLKRFYKIFILSLKNAMEVGVGYQEVSVQNLDWAWSTQRCL